jgi:hypothetical protein
MELTFITYLPNLLNRGVYTLIIETIIMYFQIGYSTTVNEVVLDFFIGATPGSEENPYYYGAENFSVINVGINASKSLKITEDYSLPILVSFIVNPRVEIAHLVFGISF